MQQQPTLPSNEHDEHGNDEGGVGLGVGAFVGAVKLSDNNKNVKYSDILLTCRINIYFVGDEKL